MLWVLMITSAENRPWVGDVTFGDSYAASGLPAPSVVRTTKIATIEASHAERIGKVPEELASAVTQELKAILKF